MALKTLKRKKLSGLLPGGYRWKREVVKGKVTYSVYDMEMFAIGDKAPIAAVHPAVKKMRSVLLTKKFAAEAMARTNSKIDGGYLPPAHIDHNEKVSGKSKRKVGFFVNLSFGTGTKHRPNRKVVYCDLVGIKPRAFKAIAEDDLPYRSVEILSKDNPDFSSLALMFSTPPYLQFKNLTVKLGKKDWATLVSDVKDQSGEDEQFAVIGSSLCFSAKSETSPYVIVSQFNSGSANMKVKRKGKKAKGAKLSAGGGRSKKSGSRIDRLEAVVNGLARNVQSLLDREAGELEDAAPIVNSATSTTRRKKSKKREVTSGVDARLTALEEFRRDTDKTMKLGAKYEKIVNQFSALKAKGYDLDPEAEAINILETAKKPLAATKAAIARIEAQEPKFSVGEWDDEENGLVIDYDDPIIKKFHEAGEGEEVIECAAKAVRDYRNFNDIYGAGSGLTLEHHVLAEVSRFQAANDIMPQRDYYLDIVGSPINA